MLNITYGMYVVICCINLCYFSYSFLCIIFGYTVWWRPKSFVLFSIHKQWRHGRHFEDYDLLVCVFPLLVELSQKKNFPRFSGYIIFPLLRLKHWRYREQFLLKRLNTRTKLHGVKRQTTVHYSVIIPCSAIWPLAHRLEWMDISTSRFRHWLSGLLWILWEDLRMLRSYYLRVTIQVSRHLGYFPQHPTTSPSVTSKILRFYWLDEDKQKQASFTSYL
jgi:hypothetical protein